MGKHPGLATRNSAESILRAAAMASQSFVFPHGPPHEEAIEVSEYRVEGGLIELAEVLNPASKDRIPHARQVVDSLVASQMESPA